MVLMVDHCHHLLARAFWVIQFKLIVERIALVATVATFMVKRGQDLETLGPAYFSTLIFYECQYNLMRISGKRFPTIWGIVTIIVEFIGPAQQAHRPLMGSYICADDTMERAVRIFHHHDS